MDANIRDNVVVTDPKTLAEREKVAKDFVAQFSVKLPIVVDTLDDTVEKAYLAWPDRMYVIDADGKVAYQGRPGPAGFKPEEIPPVLDKLLGIASSAPVTPPAPLPPQLQRRIDTLAMRLELSEEKKEAIITALRVRVAALDKLQEARLELLQGAMVGRNPQVGMEDWEMALKVYQKTVADSDMALEKATKWSADARLRAALTGMGLIGNQPLLPMTAPPRPNP